MAEGEARQYFVRNDKGIIWGPLTLPSIELLIDNGIIKGQVQVSEDGLRFAFPGRFPHIRDAFPRELWGDVIAPGPTVQVAKAEIPLELMGQSAAPAPSAPAPQVPGAAPMAGPGAISQATAPRPGPGAMPQPGAPRPGPGAMPQAAAPVAGPSAAPRPGVPGANPGVAAQAAVPRPGPGVGAPAGAPMAGPGVRPAAAPGAAPVNPSGSFRPVAPAAAAPAAAAPAAPAPAAAAAPAASPRVPPVMTPSGMFAAVASPPAPPTQGSLEQLSPVALYGRIGAGNLTGLLTLTLPDRAILLHFRKGSPEFVDSSHPEDALGTMLIQARLLAPEQLQQAEGARGRFGGELLAALFGMGLLQPATAFNHLSQRALSILHKGLRAESGTFTYETKELPAAKAMPLGNKWAVLSEQVRRFASVDIKRRLGPVLNLPIMKSEGLVATSELRLTPHEVRMLTFIDGVRSLGQLLTDFPQDTEYLLRLAFLLKELDAVSFAAVPHRAPEPKAAAPHPPPAAAAPKPAAPQPAPAPAAAAPRPAAPQPAQAAAAAPRPAAPQPAPAPAAAAPRPAAPQPAPAQAPAAAAAPRPAAPQPAPAQAPAAAAPKPAAPVIKPAAPAAPQPAAPVAAAPAPAGNPGTEDIATLRQTAATLKAQNHFERLGLTDQADAGAVKIAYFKMAKLYHPDTLPPGASPELEKLKAEIFGYIGDAYRTLTDDKSRKDYIEQIKSGDTGKEEVDVVAILQAEERFKKGIVFMKSRKYAEAVTIFDEAIKLNAEEAEFHAWRGYARFCAATDKKAALAEAFREIQGAIKKNERCAAAHYFLGVIAKTLGDLSGAQKHFKRTVEIQPDHIDAQREIRMAAQKK